MVEIFGLLTRSKKKAVYSFNKNAMELETAKEILAEVFRISIEEVEEMILNRFEMMETNGVTSHEITSHEATSRDDGLWPLEFSVSV